MSKDKADASSPSLQKFNCFENQLKPFTRFLVYLKVPLTIAIVSCIFFGSLDQTIEVYRVIAFDRNILQAIYSTLSVVFLSLSIWFSGRTLEKYYSDYQSNVFWVEGDSPSASTTDTFKCLYENLPRLLGIIPLLSLAYGVWATRQTLENLIDSDPKNFLLLWMIIDVGLAVVVFLLYVYRTEFFNRFENSRRFEPLFSMASSNSGQGLFGKTFENIFVNIACILFSFLALPTIAATSDLPWTIGLTAVFILIVTINGFLLFWQDNRKARFAVLYAAAVSLLASFIAVRFSPTFLPEYLGSISVVAISLMILAIVFSTIYYWGLKTKIPGITILIVLIFVSSLFDFNDNHRFRQFSNPEKAILPSLESSFQQWLANRPDRDQFLNKPYPVYIGAAQGGGIYAAYHAATTFSKLTEYFPSFPQHVFAISAVSGGSLGAAAFSSLVNVGEVSHSLSQKSSQLFSSDLLAPLLTMGLFPDLIQRIIPFPIYDWDRGAGLEVAFERAWDKLLPDRNPLRQSFYRHWQPQSIAPALVLNTTVVETGARLVFSPFQILLPNKENIALDEPNLDLRLSTASVLSARFPYFTPVGWYETSDRHKLRLADGGYFDNSGIPTALDIGRNLQRIKGYGTTFEIVYLSLIDAKFDSAPQFKSEGLNEVFSPVRALFRARESRSRSAVELSTFTLNDGIDDPFVYKFRTLFLTKAGGGVNLPLGWLLSDRSREFIDRQINDPRLTPCDRAKFRQSAANNSQDLFDNHNRCTIASIANDLIP